MPNGSQDFYLFLMWYFNVFSVSEYQDQPCVIIIYHYQSNYDRCQLENIYHWKGGIDLKSRLSWAAMT